MKKYFANYKITNYEKEDARVLQKKVSGASVYKSIAQLYRRTPKHRKLSFHS